jgi:hypothetical protein
MANKSNKSNRMPEQNAKAPWGEWRVNEARKSIERAEARLEHAKEVLAFVESTVAGNVEHAATRKLEAKQERLKKQLAATTEALATATA